MLLKDEGTMDPAEISCKMQREGANTPHVGAEQEIVAVQWCEVWKLRLKKKSKFMICLKYCYLLMGLLDFLHAAK